MNITAIQRKSIRVESDRTALHGKWPNLAVLSLADLLIVTVWFSASAMAQQLSGEWGLSSAQRSWLTMSVQLGFVAGALVSAALNLPDRISARGLVGVSAIAGAAFNAAIPVFDVGFAETVALRLLTGFSLAGAYPTSMKLVATWCREDRGFGIGIMVGALAVGSASPHLIAGLSPSDGGISLPWRDVLLTTSGLAIIGGLLTLAAFRPGPYLSGTAPFNWKYAGKILSHRPSRLATFGYLGHMWELFAMWTWVPIFLLESFRAAGLEMTTARFVGFATVAAGGIGCVLAGKFADSRGRTSVTIVSMLISGACAMIAGYFGAHPLLLTAVCVVWGFAVVADSAQFSAAISELTDPLYVGTALTVQTSLGFLLTAVTIQIIPELVRLLGWGVALMVLAIGPAGGIWAMARLRGLPEARLMAGGRR
jgi:MFS family permease